MAATAPSPRIWLTLLLQGGHRESLAVDADSPLLDKLRDTLIGKLSQPWLFQIPIKDCVALLTVHSSQIVAAITEPPMPLTLGMADSAGTAAAVRAPVDIYANQTGFVDGQSSSKAARVENVLTAEQHRRLVEFVSQNPQLFAGSTTSTGASNYRDSLVCFRFPPFDELLRQRVSALAPQVAAQLGLELPDGEMEIQLTAHNDGHYYRVHNDSSGEGFRHRVISFVYYFNRSPKSFSGGELRIYDRDVKDGTLRAAATYQDITPLDNSVVFFDSRDMHEVMPVSCPSKDFGDSRFTINGWIGRKKTT